MTGVSVERLRQALFLLGVGLAAAAAWVTGGTLFRARSAPGDTALLARDFPGLAASKADRREDRTLESFKVITSRQLVLPAPAQGMSLGPPPFKLLGTAYNAAAPQDSTAMVLNSMGTVKGYKPGQTVDVDQAKLLAVMGSRARFLWQGTERWLGPEGPAVDPLLVRKPQPPVRDAETSFTLSAAEWRSYTQDSFRLLQQVRTEPVEGGGLRIRAMHEDFPGRRFGLQEGDVVHKVNGRALDNLQVLGDLVKVLGDPQPLRIEIARAGRPVTLSIQVGEAAVPKP